MGDPAPGRPFLRTLRDHPSALLLAAQVAAILAYPGLGDTATGRAFLGLIGTVVVLLALGAVRRTPALTWVAVLLGAPAMICTILEAISPTTDGFVLASAALHAPFYFYVSFGMIRYLFHDERVTRDELFATGAAFTVVAWGFAYLFSATQVVWPGSFSGGEHTWFELLFLSFTTLTSLGLSDITPALPHARSFVMLEAIAGVFYVALVVSRLVGLTVTTRRRED